MWFFSSPLEYRERVLYNSNLKLHAINKLHEYAHEKFTQKHIFLQDFSIQDEERKNSKEKGENHYVPTAW